MTEPLYINFLAGKIGYRRRHSHTGNELLAKAIGIKGDYKPTVIDATAGLGRDAVIMAHLGCQVTMLERSPAVAILLEEALKKALLELKIVLSLIQVDAKEYLLHLKSTDYPDVIYLDPMYPERKKSALVKKEMRILREIVGDDKDASDLLKVALHHARKRIVVKRAKTAPCLADLKPNFIIKGSQQRFDVYLPTL